MPCVPVGGIRRGPDLRRGNSRLSTQVPEPTEEYIKLTRLEGIVVSVLCAVLLVVLLFAPK